LATKFTPAIPSHNFLKMVANLDDLELPKQDVSAMVGMAISVEEYGGPMFKPGRA